MTVNRVAAILMALLPSRLRILLLRRCYGAEIAPGVHLSIGSIVAAESIELGSDARIGPLTILRASTLVMGPRASIGGLCYIAASYFELGPQAKLSSLVQVNGDWRDPRCQFRGGMASWVFPRCFIDVTRPVQLGRNVGVGGSSFLFTHGLWLSSIHGFPTSRAPITIGDDTWLPWRCFITPGVTIGKRVIIGAQSLVNRDVPDDTIAGGLPARVIGESAKRMPHEERFGLMRSLLEEYAARRPGAAVEVVQDGRLVLSLNGGALAVLHTEASRLSAEGVLELVWTVPADLEYRRKRLYCIEDFRCSPWADLSADQRDLLESFRSEGLRAYPVDELEWTPRGAV